MYKQYAGGGDWDVQQMRYIPQQKVIEVKPEIKVELPKEEKDYKELIFVSIIAPVIVTIIILIAKKKLGIKK